MGTVKRLAEEVERGRGETHPGLRQPVIKKLALAVGAMLDGQTPNPVEWATLLPLETARQDRREPGLRRLVKNPVLRREVVIAPWARPELERAARYGQTVRLSLEQTDLGKRMAVLMVCVRVGDRSLPLAWTAAVKAAHIGFAGPRLIVERVRAWLPAGAEGLVSADRFYPSGALFEWRHRHGGRYRLRLKGTRRAAAGEGEERTTGAWARDVKARYLPGGRLFADGVATNLGILQEAGHEEPWSIAMACFPTRAAVLDDGARWGIEPLVSAFTSRGVEREASQREHADRLERLILIRSLAMEWCGCVGRDEAVHRPTPLEKKLKRRPTRTMGASENSTAAGCLGSNEGGVA